MRLQLTPTLKAKTQVRQRLLAGGSMLAVTLLFGIGVFMYGNFGNSNESLAALSSNMGFENTLTNWTVGSGTWVSNATASQVRSGSKSVKNTANTTVDKQLKNTSCTISAPASGTNYITVSAWILGSSTNGRVRFAIYDVTNSTETIAPTYSSTTASYAFASYTFSAINGHTYYPILYAKNNTAGSVDVYFDDVMMYTSSSSTTDQTAPAAATAVTASSSGTSNTFNFTQGTDAASGIDGILILRQSGIQSADQTVNNQTTYSTTSTTGPTTAGSYSVVYNGSAVSTYTDNPGSTGSYTYLIYMRDKNYNYTALTSATRIWVMNGASLTAKVSSSTSIDALYIPATNTLTIGSAATLTLRTGTSLTVSGTLKLQGIITNNGNITFANGSTFDYNRNGSATAGTGIPTATWSTGSTCLVTGATSTVPLGTGQTFYHFTWNCTSQTANNLYLSPNFNCNGNFTILDSGVGSSPKKVWLDGVNHIKGDLHVAAEGNINFDYGSTIYLDGSSLQNIDNVGGYLWFQNVIIDNAAGIKLLDNVLVDSITTLRNGNVNINGKLWDLEDMAQVVRENGTLTGSFTPNLYYDLTYKNAVSTGSELSTYSDEIYRLNLNLTGNIILSGNANINHSLNFTSGKLETGSFEAKLLTTSTSAITGYGSNNYVIGNLRRNVATTGSYYFPVGTSTKYEQMNVNFTLQTGVTSLLVYFNATSPGTPTGITVSGVAVNNMLNIGYWTMTPNSTMTGGSYTSTGLLTGYTNTGLNANTNYYLLKRANSSSPWQALGTQITVSGQSSGNPIQFAASGLTGFSDFGAGYGGGSTLPITLSSFNVSLVDNEYVNLEWVTSAELNNEYFAIERSADGKDFETIGRVEGHGTSLVKNEYSFKDETPLDGTSYYRLKQVDFDGPFTYSAIQSLNNAQVVLTADDVNVFPNPATTEINVAVQIKKEGDQEIQIIDLSGRMVYSQIQSFYEGQNQFKLPLDNLPTGFYFVKFGAEGQAPVLKKFLKN